MQLDAIRAIEGKELRLFFSSPVAYLFVGVFLLVTLFLFFWIEAFFARNIADVRPLFEWMPVLLIFLSSALTMRLWSEERRTGTLEFVATLPIGTWDAVLGKFFACWRLLALALLLTLPLPITVSFIADLDWGPVVTGYVAALLLGGAYLAIGLFVSSLSDSQIVSLLLSALLCGLFYLLGSPALTGLVGGDGAELLRALGSGSRFESITRGVLDLRDLYYYASILLAFLALNVLVLQAQRWAGDGSGRRHRAWLLGTAALVANLLVANLWLGTLTGLRLDMTEGRLYSISEATRSYLGQLREPLLIRGYFSNKTHPLLAPLVPQMRDLLKEFEIAGGDRVRVEIIDPAENPELEEEANSKYGIRSVPFQVADRRQAALVNSYFDVLVSYGDEYEVLGFRDLIEVKVESESELDVQLRNPEYDLTRSIKKVLQSFQGGDSVFENIAGTVAFTGYISPDARLPEALADYREVLQGVLDDLVVESDGRFSAEILDPEDGDGALARQIEADYGFRPMAASLFDLNSFYFYLTLADGEELVQVPLPEALSAEATRQALEDGLERFASGVLKTVALSAPGPQTPPMAMGMPPQGSPFSQLRDYLAVDYRVESAELASGRVPEAAEVLLVVDPQNLDETGVFALDQFLMRGGTVILATAPFATEFGETAITATARQSGLEDWLAHHGLTLEKTFVMDPQNAAFPAPVTRQVGGFSFQELVMLDYPYFVDVRGDGLNEEAPINAGLPQLTVTWPSPITVDEAVNAGRTVTPLLSSSPASWTSDDTDVMPRLNEMGLSGFDAEGERGARLLAVMVEGRFDSYFAGKPSPLLEAAAADDDADGATDDDADAEDGAEAEAEEDGLGTLSTVIDRSPESARLLLFASNDFLADQTLQLVGSADGIFYTNSLQLMANAADYAVEDRALLSIRGRGRFNRTLPPLEASSQTLLEFVNYGAALLGLGLIYLVYRQRQGAARARYRRWLSEGGS